VVEDEDEQLWHAAVVLGAAYPSHVDEPLLGTHEPGEPGPTAVPHALLSGTQTETWAPLNDVSMLQVVPLGQVPVTPSVA
jgi:hypothetical protein